MGRFHRILLKRRRVLRLSLLAGVLAGAHTVFGAAAARLRVVKDPLASLPAFLDTLLPADGDSPGASALDLHRRVMAHIRTAGGRRFIAWGCGWLDGEARRRGAPDFASAGPGVRERIVAQMAGFPPARREYVFFDAVRADAFRLYYADPRSWPALGYDGPPQPAGFPDHASPPGRER